MLGSEITRRGSTRWPAAERPGVYSGVIAKPLPGAQKTPGCSRLVGLIAGRSADLHHVLASASLPSRRGICKHRGLGHSR